MMNINTLITKRFKHRICIQNISMTGSERDLIENKNKQKKNGKKIVRYAGIEMNRKQKTNR